jgi:hypothetical protein
MLNFSQCNLDDTDDTRRVSEFGNDQSNESEIDDVLYIPPTRSNYIIDTPTSESFYLVNAIDFITNTVSWQMWRERNFYKTSIRMTIGSIHEKWDELNKKEKTFVRSLVSNEQQCFLSNILYNKFYTE